MQNTIKVIGILIVFAVGTAAQANVSTLPSPARFNTQDELLLPDDYREWIYAGSNVSPHELNGGKAPFNEMRVIYIDRGSFSEWKETGKFRDGTLILKEVLTSDHYSGVTGKGYAAKDVVAVAGMLKDANRFPNQPGNWGFYRFPKLEDSKYFQKTSKTNQTQCQGCHVAAADDDLVFTQHYPVLRHAKGTGVIGVPLEK